MENFSPLDNTEQSEKRPVFLTVIGIFTFINLGVGALGVLSGFITGPASSSQVKEVLTTNMKQIALMREQKFDGIADMMEKMINFISYTNDAHYLLNTLNLAIVGLGIYGVILMFKRRKLGFHLYIISCIIRILSFYTCSPFSEVPTILVMYYVFTSGLFIFLYSRNLKWIQGENQ